MNILAKSQQIEVSVVALADTVEITKSSLLCLSVTVQQQDRSKKIEEFWLNTYFWINSLSFKLYDHLPEWYKQFKKMNAVICHTNMFVISITSPQYMEISNPSLMPNPCCATLTSTIVLMMLICSWPLQSVAAQLLASSSLAHSALLSWLSTAGGRGSPKGDWAWLSVDSEIRKSGVNPGDRSCEDRPQEKWAGVCLIFASCFPFLPPPHAFIICNQCKVVIKYPNFFCL